MNNVDQPRHDFKSAFVAVADRYTPIIRRRVRGIDNCPRLNKPTTFIVRLERLIIPRTGLVIVAIKMVCRTLIYRFSQG